MHDGPSYTGSTPALGAGRLGPIPSSPTKNKLLLPFEYRIELAFGEVLRDLIRIKRAAVHAEIDTAHEQYLYF